MNLDLSYTSPFQPEIFEFFSALFRPELLSKSHSRGPPHEQNNCMEGKPHLVMGQKPNDICAPHQEQKDLHESQPGGKTGFSPEGHCTGQPSIQEQMHLTFEKTFS
jgi:hypothetical protein